MTRKEFLQAAVGSSVLGSIGVGTTARNLQQGGSSAPAPARTLPAGTTKAVVDFISKSSFDRMPPRVVGQAKRCLIDGFGVVLAGATVRGSAIVREHIKASGVQTAQRSRTRKLAATSAQAALANGASGHAMDYDGVDRLASVRELVAALS